MFARIMGVVSPSIFLASSIVWGLSTGHPVAVVLSIALGASAAFMSFRAWHRVDGDVSLASVTGQEVAAAVRVAWKRYWKNAAFIAALYGLNLVLSLVFKGAYRFRAWDVFILWFIVDGMALSSWVEMLRKRVGDLAGDGDVS